MIIIICKNVLIGTFMIGTKILPYREVTYDEHYTYKIHISANLDDETGSYVEASDKNNKRLTLPLTCRRAE